jgi:hypothetical protein
MEEPDADANSNERAESAERFPMPQKDSKSPRHDLTLFVRPKSRHSLWERIIVVLYVVLEQNITTSLYRRDEFSDFAIGVSAVIFRIKLGNLHEGWAWKDRRVPRQERHPFVCVAFPCGQSSSLWKRLR